MGRSVLITRRLGARNALPFALVCLAVLASAGCRSGYIARMGLEQVRYLARARPIEQVLAEEGDPGRREKLALVLEARKFARSRGLDPGGSFRKITDTSKSPNFHVVTAAWTDRLEPYTWWYPVVGRLPYRGYFDVEDAEAYAATLDPEQLDVRIVEASAYSTLGWFDDPLPSSLLADDVVGVVATVLHELVHQNFFAPGSVAFNETLANAAGSRLAEDFFARRGEPERAERVRRWRAAWLARGRIFDRLADRLTDHFRVAATNGLSRERMLAGRAAIYAEAQQEIRDRSLAYPSDDPFLVEPLDNARFLSIYRYSMRADRVDHALEGYDSMASALEALDEAVSGAKDPFEALPAPVTGPPSSSVRELETGGGA